MGKGPCGIQRLPEIRANGAPCNRGSVVDCERHGLSFNVSAEMAYLVPRTVNFEKFSTNLNRATRDCLLAAAKWTLPSQPCVTESIPDSPTKAFSDR